MSLFVVFALLNSDTFELMLVDMLATERALLPLSTHGRGSPGVFVVS